MPQDLSNNELYIVIMGNCSICCNAYSEALEQHPKFKEIYDNIKSWPANNVEYVKFCVTLKELEEKYKTKVCRLDDMQICRTCLLKIADELL